MDSGSVLKTLAGRPFAKRSGMHGLLRSDEAGVE